MWCEFHLNKKVITLLKKNKGIIKHHIQKAHFPQVYKSRTLYPAFSPTQSDLSFSASGGICLSVCVIFPFCRPPSVTLSLQCHPHRAPPVLSHFLHCSSRRSYLLAVLLCFLLFSALPILSSSWHQAGLPSPNLGQLQALLGPLIFNGIPSRLLPRLHAGPSSRCQPVLIQWPGTSCLFPGLS